jgi:macrolide transport system ATP-binding/permease protein
MEAVENALGLYEGTLLFVSHDRKLIGSIADRLIFIEGCRLNTFEGNYAEYNEFNMREASGDAADSQKQKLLLETRLSEVLGRLSMPGKGDNIELLDMEYKKILAEIRKLESGK